MSMTFLQNLPKNPTFLVTLLCVVVALVVAIWFFAYVARVASEFGRGIFLALLIMFVVGLWMGPAVYNIANVVTHFHIG